MTGDTTVELDGVDEIVCDPHGPEGEDLEEVIVVEGIPSRSRAPAASGKGNA